MAFSPECIIVHLLSHATGHFFDVQNYLFALLDNGFDSKTITNFALSAPEFETNYFEQILEENPTLKTIYHALVADIEFQIVYFNVYLDVKKYTCNIHRKSRLGLIRYYQ